jgi:hypothetical protein
VTTSSWWSDSEIILDARMIRDWWWFAHWLEASESAADYFLPAGARAIKRVDVCFVPIADMHYQLSQRNLCIPIRLKNCT